MGKWVARPAVTVGRRHDRLCLKGVSPTCPKRRNRPPSDGELEVFATDGSSLQLSFGSRVCVYPIGAIQDHQRVAWWQQRPCVVVFEVVGQGRDGYGSKEGPQ
jgi:hypothetical protein